MELDELDALIRTKPAPILAERQAAARVARTVNLQHERTKLRLEVTETPAAAKAPFAPPPAAQPRKCRWPNCRREPLASGQCKTCLMRNERRDADGLPPNGPRVDKGFCACGRRATRFDKCEACAQRGRKRAVSKAGRVQCPTCKNMVAAHKVPKVVKVQKEEKTDE